MNFIMAAMLHKKTAPGNRVFSTGSEVQCEADGIPYLYQFLQPQCGNKRPDLSFCNGLD